jgi:hypothetical protein
MQDSTDQNQSEQMITLSKADLLNLLDTAAIQAVEKKTKNLQFQDSNLEMKLNSTNQQLHQLRIQQQSQNQSQKQETKQLREEVKESFDGLGNLIEKKLKPLEQLNQRMSKQLPLKTDSNHLNGSSSSISARTVIGSTSRNANDGQGYTISQPKLTYYPPETIESEYRKPKPKQWTPPPETSFWMELAESIETPINWIESILRFIFNIFRLIFQAVTFLAILAPQFLVGIVILIFTGIIMLFIYLIWLMNTPTHPFGR